MPDPALSAAIQEAYASAPVDQVIYHTLELWHPAFSLPIRVVRNASSIDARIEAGAARDAGALVTFAGYAFDVVPPASSAEALPQCVIEIDNVSRDILAQVQLAVSSAQAITVIYRQYLSDLLDIGPETDPPLELTMLAISANPLRLRATAGFANLLDLKFPSLDYDLDHFPGLTT